MIIIRMLIIDNGWWNVNILYKLYYFKVCMASLIKLLFVMIMMNI